jgi:hypothetical protein
VTTEELVPGHKGLRVHKDLPVYKVLKEIRE